MIIEKSVSLSTLPSIEDWLNEMATGGYELLKIEGRKFYFSKSTSAKTKHFYYAFFIVGKEKQLTH